MDVSRRKFIESASALTLSAVVPSVAKAQAKVGLSGPSYFNGHKIQTNFDFWGYPSHFPVLNLMKTGTPWRNFTDPTYLDANGYPIRAAWTQTTLTCPSQVERPGRYVIKGDGNGTIKIDNVIKNQPVSGSWRYTFQPPTNSGHQINFYILTTNPAPNNIRNVRICHVDDEADLDAGKIWRQEFVNLCKNFGVLRFMNWQFDSANLSNVAHWADRTPLNYAMWTETFPSDVWCGTITQDATDPTVYTAIMPGFVLRDKAKLLGKFNTNQIAGAFVAGITKESQAIVTLRANVPAAWRPGMKIFISHVKGMLEINYNTYTILAIDPNGNNPKQIRIDANTTTFKTWTNSGVCGPVCTLNVSGTGAIPIGGLGGEPSINTASNGFGTSGISSLVYDAGVGNWRCRSAVGTGGIPAHKGINGFVPIEACVALANEVGAHPWFTIPILACDGPGDAPTVHDITDYAYELAIYCKNNLKEGLIPRFEACNEVWNNGFPTTQYAYYREWIRHMHHGDDAMLSQYGSDNWYGTATSLVGQAISAAFNNDRTKYQMVCGFQLFGGTSGDRLRRLESNLFVTQSGNSNNAAKNWVTHIAPASYWSPGYFGTATETSMATEYATASPSRQQELLTHYVQSAVNGLGTNSQTIPKIALKFSAFHALATTYNVKFTLYEGGFETPYSGNTTLDNFRKAAKRHPLIQDYTIQNWNNFYGVGPRAEYPSEFEFSAASTWGIWDPNTYADPTPRWLAIQKRGQ